MEPSSHELQHLSGQTTSPSAEHRNAARQRVRFNNPAAGTPASDSYARLHDSEVTQPASDKSTAEAEKLLKAHRQGDAASEHRPSTPLDENEDYAVSGNAQGGVFYQLLQAYKSPVLGESPSETSVTPPSPPFQRPASSSAPGSSGFGTPRRKWYEHDKDVRSQETLATLVGAATELANPHEKQGLEFRRAHKRNSSSRILSAMWKAKDDQDAKIKIHVAGILKRQQYIVKMCRALMLFGAPTHRLEEYLATTAKVLEINSQFLYVPGCMIISFDDLLTHTAEVKIVRTAQGVNLAKLKDTHEIYKEVLHDVISLDDALSRLDDVINAKDRHPVWLCVLMYGLASAAVSTFFKARLIDMPIIFGLGLLLGFLQLVVAPLSKTYTTVFEVSASILMSFLARAFGSIHNNSIFCYSAIAQGSIAMILPGWVCTNRRLRHMNS